MTTHCHLVTLVTPGNTKGVTALTCATKGLDGHGNGSNAKKIDTLHEAYKKTDTKKVDNAKNTYR